MTVLSQREPFHARNRVSPQCGQHGVARIAVVLLTARHPKQNKLVVVLIKRRATGIRDSLFLIYQLAKISNCYFGSVCLVANARSRCREECGAHAPVRRGSS